MELRQRKRINNLPRFDGGTDLAGIIKSTGGDITGMNAYRLRLTSIPTKKEINGMRIPGKSSFGSSLSSDGGGISSGVVTNAVNGTLGMINGFNSMQDAVKGSNELMALSGQRTDLAFGINYQALNDINSQLAMDGISKSNRNNTIGMVGSGAAAGAAIGSVVPGVGTLLGGAAGAVIGLFGGLFGGRKARERLRKKIFNAQLKVNLVNLVNLSSAATEGLTLQYYLDNGNTYDDVLYANRGKDLIKPRYVKRK